MSRFKLLRLISNYISLDTLRRFLDFLKHYFGGLFRRLDEHHIFLSAAGFAFSIIISIIPLTLILFSVVGNVIDVSTIEENVDLVISTIIPYPEAAAYAKQFILSRVPDVIKYKTIAGYLGTFGIFFTSTWLFSSMRTILNRVFGVTEKKSEWIGMLRDFGMVILTVLLIVLSTFILPIFNILIDAASNIEFLQFFNLSDLLNTIFSLATIVVIYVMFFLLYTLIPYENLGKKVPAIAALWAVILWESARSIFGYYVTNFLSTNKIYGAFLVIAVVIFWIFYSSILFIVAAEIGQLYRERKRRRKSSKRKKKIAKA